MSLNEAIIPFPCHPEGCKAVVPLPASPRVYKQCAVCGKAYEIDTTAGRMRRMVPDALTTPERQLLDEINEILQRGDDVVIRQARDGGIKVLRQRAHVIAGIPGYPVAALASAKTG